MCLLVCKSQTQASSKERKVCMDGLKMMLQKEEIRLEKIIQETKNRLNQAPEGTLRLSKCQGKVQYYHGAGVNKRGTYISVVDRELPRKLAQKSYDEKLLCLALKRKNQIKSITKDYEDGEIETIYWKEHPERRKLIQPVEPTWKQKLTQWKSVEYKGKEFEEGLPVIMTEKGERVRSKSEKIMADYFYRHGIEYKYECPLYLKGMGMVYPDFTFLSEKSGEEIYWEHNGKMDDPTYAKKAVRKIQTYENNQIFLGERLILTYETEQNILSTAKIEQMVTRYLI